MWKKVTPPMIPPPAISSITDGWWAERPAAGHRRPRVVVEAGGAWWRRDSGLGFGISKFEGRGTMAGGLRGRFKWPISLAAVAGCGR